MEGLKQGRVKKKKKKKDRGDRVREKMSRIGEEGGGVCERRS